jgi:protein-tyrosine phosphatase
MAEAVFRHLVREAGVGEHFEIASSGTGSWHIGDPPHRGTQAVLRKHGVDVGNQRAQQIQRSDLAYYDYILVADAEHEQDLTRMGGPTQGEMRRLLEFHPDIQSLDIPDPYYTGDFEYVYAVIMAASRGLLAHIRAERSL